jgi:hypothetical protein
VGIGESGGWGRDYYTIPSPPFLLLSSSYPSSFLHSSKEIKNMRRPLLEKLINEDVKNYLSKDQYTRI